MKKNKTVAYMLAATLLVGGTFAGTKALFSDTETFNDQLILTTGKVDIEVQENNWQRIGKNNGPIVEENELEFSNVEPGDSFVKRLDISNENSTYDVNLKIVPNHNIPEELKDIITVSTQEKNNISKGQKTSVTVKVNIEDKNDAWTRLNKLDEINLNSLYTITAEQAK